MIAVFFDYSGGMYHLMPEYDRFRAALGDTNVAYFAFGTDIQPLNTLAKGEPEVIEEGLSDNDEFGGGITVGYGGTLVAPIIEWVKRNKPSQVLVFTDGYFERVLLWPYPERWVWILADGVHPLDRLPGRTIYTTDMIFKELPPEIEQHYYSEKIEVRHALQTAMHVGSQVTVLTDDGIDVWIKEDKQGASWIQQPSQN